MVFDLCVFILCCNLDLKPTWWYNPVSKNANDIYSFNLVYIPNICLSQSSRLISRVSLNNPNKPGQIVLIIAESRFGVLALT